MDMVVEDIDKPRFLKGTFPGRDVYNDLRDALVRRIPGGKKPYEVSPYGTQAYIRGDNDAMGPNEFGLVFSGLFGMGKRQVLLVKYVVEGGNDYTKVYMDPSSFKEKKKFKQVWGTIDDILESAEAKSLDGNGDPTK